MHINRYHKHVILINNLTKVLYTSINLKCTLFTIPTKHDTNKIKLQQVKHYLHFHTLKVILKTCLRIQHQI